MYNFPESEDPLFIRTDFADTKTLTDPELPIIAVDLSEEIGQTFRVIPSEMWSVENNLSICNMGFEEFKESIDQDGIFRGFPEV